jgi:hypothetical protein
MTENIRKEEGIGFSKDLSNLYRAAAMLIMAAGEGCVKFKESTVSNGRLFIRSPRGYVMIKPWEKIGLVSDLSGNNFHQGIYHLSPKEYTTFILSWLKEETV